MSQETTKTIRHILDAIDAVDSAWNAANSDFAPESLIKCERNLYKVILGLIAEQHDFTESSEELSEIV